VSFRFDPGRGLVIVRAEVTGPAGSVGLRLALDTGATGTLVNADMLVLIGLDPAASGDRTRITTGSGVEYVARVVVPRIDALGIARESLPVLCHTLPPTTQIDGLLGLDFLRDRKLTIDFKAGIVRLA
jgi:predicted aspartyl protease